MNPPPERIDALMRRHFIVVEPGDAVENVLRLMDLARVRILPVVREGVLLGVVSYRDLARSLLHGRGLEPAAAGAKVVAELMERSPGTVPARARTETVARRLCENGYGCVPVVEPGEAGPRIVGLVTENDLLAAIYS